MLSVEQERQASAMAAAERQQAKRAAASQASNAFAKRQAENLASHERAARALEASAPNELVVGLLRGRGLPAMDQTLLGRRGKSDPIAKLSVGLDAGAKPTKSSVKMRTLEPEWDEARDAADGGRGGMRNGKRREKARESAPAGQRTAPRPPSVATRRRRRSVASVLVM